MSIIEQIKVEIDKLYGEYKAVIKSSHASKFGIAGEAGIVEPK